MNGTEHGADFERLGAALSTLDEKLLTIVIGLRALFEQQAKQQPNPFTIRVGSLNQFATPRDTTGILKFVHNPTAAPITLTLNESGSSGGPALFSAQLAAGESRFIYAVFKSGLFCLSGTECIVSGDFARV